MSKKQANYNQLRGELDEIMATLQAPSIDIDQATTLHQRANKIIDELEAYLNKTENEIKQLEKKKKPEKKT